MARTAKTCPGNDTEEENGGSQYQQQIMLHTTLIHRAQVIMSNKKSGFCRMKLSYADRNREIVGRWASL